MTQPNTIKIGNDIVDIQNLPDDIQKLVKLGDTWQKELQQSRVDLFKNEAAIRGLSMEIEFRYNNYLQTLEIKKDSNEST